MMDELEQQDLPVDLSGVTELDDGSAEIDLLDSESEITEMPDGSAIVELPDEGPEENPDFYANMAEDYDSFDLKKLATRYLDLIKVDKEARAQRDKQYEEGIKRTGLGNDAPGGATFMGASKVVHPVMAEGCVDFASRAIKEMYPPDGPVRTKILGKMDDTKAEVAERKRDYLNWQITEQIEEFRDEQEQMLTQLPLGGSQYFKLWFDETKKRPCVEFLPIDRMILPFAATNFYTAQRAAELHEITSWEFNRRIDSGMYRDVSFIKASMEPDQTKAQKANNKIEGKQFQDNEDGLRNVYHVYTWLELEDDTYTKGKMAPYILMVDELDNEVLGLYRNWEDGDETMTKLDWVVEFKFIPWRGAYAIGLPHLIGGLSAALTGSLRALLDSAHINNAATMLKLKGAKISGQSQQVEVTQIVEIEGAPGVQDIRQIAMPMPFNPPSPVLMELLGWLDKAAKGVVSTSEEKIADVNANAPVGTTQALIEQGAAVFSAIHARLHESQSRVLKILCRLNRWHLEEQRKGELVADLDISKDDFKRNTDIVPVSDPHIFSETQRMAQIQAVVARADKHPDLYNAQAVEERLLKQLKIPNVNELMKNTPAPEQRTSADENAAMLIGQPAYAYMAQDHIAHIQDHLQFGLNPFFGQSPFADPSYLSNLIEHIKQHMTLWYLNRSNSYVAQANNGNPVDHYDDPALTAQVDKAYAVVGAHVALDTQEVFQQFAPAFQQLVQQAQQRAQQQRQVLPPDAQVVKDTAMAETQRKAQADAQKAQDVQAKIASDSANKDKDIQARIAIENAKITGQAIQENIVQQNAAQMHGLEQANDVQKHSLEQQNAMQQAAMQQQATPPQPEGNPNVNI
jgi:hypothetical protein